MGPFRSYKGPILTKYRKLIFNTELCSQIECVAPKCDSFFILKKLCVSVTLWENLPKTYYFWTYNKTKRKNVTLSSVTQGVTQGLCTVFEIMRQIVIYFLVKTTVYGIYFLTQFQGRKLRRFLPRIGCNSFP